MNLAHPPEARATPRRDMMNPATLTLAAVGTAAALVLTERQRHRRNAIECEKIRQNLALYEAAERYRDDPERAALLVDNSWIANLSVMHRVGVIGTRTLRTAADYLMTLPTGPNSWAHSRKYRQREARDRQDRTLITVFDEAYEQAPTKAS
ncbi:DUF6082 family protein [Streptomyces sp. NPDC001633]|uniref:DUF6082 family protein n=1 Tax=Streptomyces sp. NPDC001633 TaxID=3364595 RepID=UPI003676BA2F